MCVHSLKLCHPLHPVPPPGTSATGAAIPSVHRHRQREARLSAVAPHEDELPGGFGRQSAVRAAAEGRHRNGGGRIASTRPSDRRDERHQPPRAVPVYGAGHEHVVAFVTGDHNDNGSCCASAVGR